MALADIQQKRGVGFAWWLVLSPLLLYWPFVPFPPYGLTKMVLCTRVSIYFACIQPWHVNNVRFFNAPLIHLPWLSALSIHLYVCIGSISWHSMFEGIYRACPFQWSMAPLMSQCILSFALLVQKNEWSHGLIQSIIIHELSQDISPFLQRVVCSLSLSLQIERHSDSVLMTRKTWHSEFFCKQRWLAESTMLSM